MREPLPQLPEFLEQQPRAAARPPRRRPAQHPIREGKESDVDLVARR